VPSFVLHTGTFSGQLDLSPGPDDASLVGASITVTNPLAGTPAVTITASSTGALTWHQYGVDNQILPGTYNLLATLTGYANATYTLVCTLATCTVPANSFVLTAGS